MALARQSVTGRCNVRGEKRTVAGPGGFRRSDRCSPEAMPGVSTHLAVRNLLLVIPRMSAARMRPGPGAILPREYELLSVRHLL